MEEWYRPFIFNRMFTKSTDYTFQLQIVTDLSY